jgi:carotenoid cleavage dioxygenase
VRTESFEGRAQFFDEHGRRDYRSSKANTHVVRHAGRILALVETSFPYQLTPDLDTVAPYDFDGRLPGAMTAHPKICPTTGEMHFFGYEFTPPFVRYHVADAAGRLVTSRDIDVAGPTMMHDFNLTERFVIFMDLPIVFDLELAMGGEPLPYRYDPSYGARLGVLGRGDATGAVRWFDVEPCYVFHPMNAHDDGTTITLDVCRLDNPSIDRTGEVDSTLWRWQIDLAEGTVTERQLDDRAGDFPRVDDRLVGLPATHGWVTSPPSPDRPGQGGAITIYDLATERSRTHSFGPGRVPGEAVLAPADDGAGGDGWLLACVYDSTRDRSDVVVLDPAEPEREPIAAVELPTRVPYCFHGSWLPDE